MAINNLDLSRSLEDMKNNALGIQTSLGQLKTRELSGNSQGNASEMDALQTSLTRQLSDALGQQSTQEKTLSERYAERKKTIEEAAKSQAALIKSESETAIEEAQKTGQRAITQELESRRGFATNAALMKDIEATNEKRVANLKKATNELLLKNETEKARTLMDLLEKEETATTQARVNYLNTLFQTSTELRAQKGFETPEQQSQRQLKTARQTAVINLQATAPGANILDSDDYQTAINKYKESKEYKQNIIKGELELEKTRTEIKEKIANEAKIRAQIDNPELTGSQLTAFNTIVNRYSTSPLISAADRTMAATNIIPVLETNPEKRENQLTAIYQFIQILDNYNSAVREGEISLLTGAQSLTENISTTYQKLTQGKIVSANTILDIVSGMKNLITSINDAAKQKEAMFASQANTVGLNKEWTKFRSGFSAPYDVQFQQNEQRTLAPATTSTTTPTIQISQDNMFYKMFEKGGMFDFGIGK